MEGDRDTGRLSENAIVGAGIAGTALGIALKQSGLAVRLYDQAGNIRQADAPVLLSANGTRVLHALGLKEELAAISLLPQFATLRHARTGFLLSQRPLGAFSEARYGAPDVLVEHAQLVQMLRAKAAALGIPLERDTPVADVDAGDAIVNFTDGRSARHLSIAVACGVPAIAEAPGLANLLNERNWSADDQLIAIRAIGHRAEPSRDHDRFINTWVADRLIAIEEPMPVLAATAEDQRLALTLLGPARDFDGANGSAAELYERMLERAHPHLRGLLAEAEVQKAAEPTAHPAEFWFAEKLVLLGAACHAHPGFPALNSSAALEDACVLSRMMERWEESPHEGFADYERYRKPRAKRLRAFARSERAILSEPVGFAAWQRNLKWSLTSRFLPEIAMQRTDWLYGYDCIKGFA